MKNKIFLLILPLCFLFLFNGKKYEDAVKDRLIVPVKICLEGQECGTAAQANQTAAAAPVAVSKVELSEGFRAYHQNVKLWRRWSNDF